MLAKIKQEYLLTIIFLLLIYIFTTGWLKQTNTSLSTANNSQTTINTPVASDAATFASEYPGVGIDNLFVYQTGEQIVEILRAGTGVVYLGFDECQWCQAYVPILNQAAKEAGIKEIYYFDILQDRKAHTQVYQDIIALLSNHLDKDEQQHPRVYVPDVTIVKRGQIIGHNNDTSQATSSKDGPAKDYWQADKALALKNKLKESMRAIVENDQCEQNSGNCNL